MFHWPESPYGKWSIKYVFVFIYYFQNGKQYADTIKLCHQRAADRIVAGAIKCGGLYIKLGQGLACFDHILPREYIVTLRILQDKVHFFNSEIKNPKIIIRKMRQLIGFQRNFHWCSVTGE